jgi:hypothetical protein
MNLPGSVKELISGRLVTAKCVSTAGSSYSNTLILNNRLMLMAIFIAQNVKIQFTFQLSMSIMSVHIYDHKICFVISPVAALNTVLMLLKMRLPLLERDHLQEFNLTFV